MASLARRFGIDEALSIRDGRETGEGAEDVTDLAKILDLRVHSVGRRDYGKLGFELEKLFYVTSLAEDICFGAFQNVLRNRLIFWGHHGDTMWDIDARPMGFRRRDNTGCSMQEARLRFGWVNFPVAFIGWQHHDALIRISQSHEMSPWSVGGAYDRPVPRRIAEESGLPRGAFGVTKSAVTVSAGLTQEDDIVSKEFQSLLDAHWAKNISPQMRVLATCCNSLAKLNKFGTQAYKKTVKKRDSGRRNQQLRGLSLEARLLNFIKISNQRRKFIRKISPITFAAQVANRVLFEEATPLGQAWQDDPRCP